MTEKELAVMEEMINRVREEYFKARPQLDFTHNIRIFEAGAERMYQLLAKTNEEKTHD